MEYSRNRYGSVGLRNEEFQQDEIYHISVGSPCGRDEGKNPETWRHGMSEMYDCSGCFDRFGGVVEPPDDYYFAPRTDEEPEWQRPDEADSVCWGD